MFNKSLHRKQNFNLGCRFLIIEPKIYPKELCYVLRVPSSRSKNPKNKIKHHIFKFYPLPSLKEIRVRFKKYKHQNSNHRFTRHNIFEKIKIKSNFAKKSILHDGISIYNNLPDKLKDI